MAEIIREIQECCVKFDQHRPHFKVLSNQYASVFPPPPPRLVFSSSKKAIFFQYSQLFSYSQKERIESMCYFYLNRRARIAYSEYRIPYSEYRIPYISM